ncbi:SurA N-terminal domain-containing protein [Catenovulum sediminis]|uniref:Periplasmic chaperone PpiD n=1 Tax=Catenovulum sediminis TaxID=1740262 RepID=A0ABV1RDS9_9ALTE
MLEKIREGSQGPVAKIILGLVIFSFALAGVGSYINSGSEPSAAEVNGNEIKRSQLERAYENEKARMESQFGEMFSQIASDPAYLANFKQGILERLISEKLISDLATRLDIRISDEEIKKTIFEMPEFQVDGKFNNDRYLQLLTRANYTPAKFRDSMREDLTRRALVQAITDTGFVLEHEAKAFQALQLQKRNLEYLEIPVELFRDSVEATEEEIQAYYDMNLDKYETPQQIDLAYVELKLEDVAANIEVTEQEIAEFYQANQSSYLKPERRRASHILIDSSEDAQAAEEEATKLLAEINAGADFSELAKTHSDDTFSGENGGDLDFFTKGVMDPAFEEAAFALQQVGDVSELVESSFGFHIIKLTGIEEETVKPLQEVRDDLVSQIQNDKARDIFLEKQQTLADLAFEIPTTLADAAEAVDLEVKHTGLTALTSQSFPFNERKVTEAALSDDVREQGYNSSVIEISGEHLVVVRVNEYQEARTLPLQEVRAQVKASVETEMAQDVAQQWVDESTAKLAAGESIENELADFGLSFKTATEVERYGSDVPAAVVKKAFEMAEPNEQVSASWVEMNPSKFALIKVLDVLEAEVQEIDVATQQRLESALVDYHYQALIDGLREQAEVVKYQTATQ